MEKILALKAQAYDLMNQINYLQQALNQIHQQIEKEASVVQEAQTEVAEAGK